MALLTNNIYTDIVLLLIIILLSIKFYLNHIFSYWKNRGIETLLPSLLFGNMSEVVSQKVSFSDVFRNYYKIMKRKGFKYCGFYALTQPNLFLLDLELIKAVLVKDFQHFTDRGMYINKKVDPLGAQLLTLNGLEWRRRRNVLSPAFTLGKLKLMFGTILNCTEGLKVLMKELAENQQMLDAKDVFGRYTTDVIASCGFGIECNSLNNPNSEFRIHGKKAFGQGVWDVLRSTMSILAPSLLDILKIPMTDAGAKKFFMNLVKETIRYREENHIIRNDFMHLLIQLKNNVNIEDEDNVEVLKEKEFKSTASLTDEQIVAEALLFFTAGFETSASTLAFCLFELASNLKIQNLLRKEIKEVLARYEGELTYNAVMEMSYMDNCVYETLRKYPIVPILIRRCTDAYKIPDSNLVIEKGVKVVIPIIGIQHDPNFYPNPDLFDPQRFSQENKAQRHQFTFLPFGEGPHICIAMKLAMAQMKVGLAALLKDYQFTVNPKTQIPILLDPAFTFACPKGGIWLNVVKLN